MKKRAILQFAISIIMVLAITLVSACISPTPNTTPDTTAPTVSSTIPVNAATGVAINNAITAIFSEAMNPLTIITVTFILKQGDTPVLGTVSYSKVSAIFVPASSLAPSIPYTATITTGAKDPAGNALASNYTWSFTTGESPNTAAPMVSSTIPVNSTTGVAINRAITAIFSEAMDPLTVTKTTFTLKQGATSVSGTITYSNVSAVFVPASSLAYNTVYTATITTGAKDLAGNALASNYTWSFTTGTAPDTTSPTVTGTINVNGQTNVPINAKVGATFSEAMDPLTITNVTFTLKQGAASVLGTITYSNVSAVFVPASNLAYNTVYTVTITTGVKDLAGNAMAAPYTLSWTTGTAPDTTAPTVIGTLHDNGETNVPINTKVGATFSEALDPLTVTTATFTLKQGTTSVLGTITYSNVSAVFVPANNLAYNTVYTVTITTGVKDLAGNAMAAPYTLSWTTGTALDTTAPTVNSAIPTNLAMGVATNSAITAIFSEMLDPLTITNVTFTLKQGTAPVSGTVNYVGVTATFTPSSSLAASTVYTATITTVVKDLAGNTLASNFIWSFTTGTQIAQAPISLGLASTFAILAGSGISNTGATTQVNGDVGTSPTGTVTGLPPAQVNGTIHTADAIAAQAKIDLLAAYNDAVSRSVGSQPLPGNLGGLTFTPGLYTNSTSVLISGGDVTLDAQGDTNAVFIFKIGSTLTTGPGSQVVLRRGAKASNVYWQVGSSATLDTTTIFKGNILAVISITLKTGAELDGRALTQTGAVTLDSSTITVPARKVKD